MEPVDPASMPDGDVGDEPMFIDIGIEPTRPSTRQALAAPSEATRGRAPWKIVAAIAGLVAAIALVFGLAAGNDRAADRALPPPTVDDVADALPPVPTAAALPDPARPAPTTVVVPIVRGDIIRAGERCELAVPSTDQPESIVSFVVPDGLSARCGSETRFWTDPVSARNGVSPLPVGVDVWPDTDLNLHFVRLGERLPDTLDYRPVAGRRAWRYSYAPIDNTTHADEQVWPAFDSIVFEVPGGSVDVSRIDEDSPVATGDLSVIFDQLVGSIQVSPIEPDPFHELPVPFGWCAGNHWVTEIPAGWFAGDRCRWLNTSSESPVVLQCECLPPLWVEPGTIPFDGDFGFSRVDSDRLETRADGTTVRIIEGLRRDSNNFGRGLRAVVVDAGPERVVIIAAIAPEHALPGHTWEDTLAAQEALVASLRFHSGDDCGVGQRWIATDQAGNGGDVAIDLDGRSWPVPVGTALIGTGCTSREAGRLEVRLEVDPTVIGWLPATAVVSPDVTSCPTAERTFRPTEWRRVTEGDFDGDGRVDTAYVRRPFDGAPTFTDVPTLAVLFADGGLAEGVVAIDGVDADGGFDVTVRPRRILGYGRDLLELQRPDSPWLDFRDATTCLLDPVSSGLDRPDGEGPVGHCSLRVPGRGETTRLWGHHHWSEVGGMPDGWTDEIDLVQTARFGQVVRGILDDGRGPCGPPVTRAPISAQPPSEEAPLHGTHVLTLQWLSARDVEPGTITFRVTPDGRYLVDGVQQADDGEFIEVAGVVQVIGPDELHFDGTITTLVARLNGGERCVRAAGQRFVRRTGTDTFRLVDRINCDGARTDWIDLTLTAPLSD